MKRKTLYKDKDAMDKAFDDWSKALDVVTSDKVKHKKKKG